jgi:hypothetical protein
MAGSPFAVAGSPRLHLVAAPEDAKRPQRVPAALAARLLHLDEQRPGDAFLERPATVLLAPAAQQLDCVVDTLVVDPGRQPR